MNYIYSYIQLEGFPGGSDGKDSACKAGDLGLTLVQKVPWRRAWLPTPSSCLENPMDTGAWWVTVRGLADWTQLSD